MRRAAARRASAWVGKVSTAARPGSPRKRAMTLRPSTRTSRLRNIGDRRVLIGAERVHETLLMDRAAPRMTVPNRPQPFGVGALRCVPPAVAPPIQRPTERENRAMTTGIGIDKAFSL